MDRKDIELISELLPIPDDVSQQFWSDVARDALRAAEIEEACGHNPQRLLTDQRSLYKKLADNPAALADIAKQVLGDAVITNPPFDFASGGTLTGRRPSQPEIQYLKPADEVVLSRRCEPTFRHVDYSRVERRVAQSLRIDLSAIDGMSDSFAQASAAVERFNAKFSAMRAHYEAAVINGMFAVYIKTPPRRPMTRSERIEYLMRSKDPRQRKRGARMAKDEFRRVFGDLPSNWNRSTHRMDFDRDPPLRSFYDTMLGQPYDDPYDPVHNPPVDILGPGGRKIRYSRYRKD